MNVSDLWLLGRADLQTGTFCAVVPDSVHVPGRRTRLAAADRR